MPGVIEIPKGERGVIHVFDLDMRPEQAAFLREPGALAQILGISDIDLDQVEIFPVEDLEELGLAGYLMQGCGIPDEEVSRDLALLEAVSGHVLLIRSRAFGGNSARLTPAEQIKPLVSYSENPVNWDAQPQQEPESSKPYSAPKLSPRQARSAARRIGASLFAIVMSLIVVLILILVF